MVAAVLVGPILAVQVTQYLDRRREARNRRLALFRTLMATRGTRLAPQHVEALNMIDVEFHGKGRRDRGVVEAWKAYLDHLNDRAFPRETWEVRCVELLVDLLYRMAVCLEYDFDKTSIKNTSYIPSGWGDVDNDNYSIRKATLAVLNGQATLRVHMVPSDAFQAAPEIRPEKAVEGKGNGDTKEGRRTRTSAT